MKFYFESDMGCGIRTYPDLEKAQEGIRREVGTANQPKNIHEATAQDIAWVRGMGGHA